MRKNLLAILFCVAAMFNLNTESKAQVLLAYWNFNTDSAAALTPNVSIVSGTSLEYAGAYYDTVQPGTTLNGVGADGTSLSAGSASLRLRNPATGPFTLTLPTTGYKNIVLTYAEERTNKGSQQNIVTYTIDGTTWINTAIAATATYTVDSVDTVSNAFQLESFNFSTDTNVNNNPHFMVQITFAVGDTNSSGNDRFDNITLRGDSLSSTLGIASITSVAPGYILYPNPVTNNIFINATLDGVKSVVITDVTGAVVYKGTQTGKHFSINTSTLIAGNYFMSISANNSNSLTTMKFIKQ